MGMLLFTSSNCARHERAQFKGSKEGSCEGEGYHSLQMLR
ncbi:hypothetical protein PAV_3c05610 [Paenibacillus alvei DSM 29]|nr:hypothetical protein PAV_3c05610 [Paenibacillus alvei DSM 29]